MKKEQHVSTVNISIPRLGDKEQCLRTFLWISVLYDIL